ncbi:hypothetical protein Tco_0474173, partial [Tanacetum coccineum]
LISASVLRRDFDEFCLSSGLRPNMAKSTVYFGNVRDDVKSKIMMAMPFNEGSFSIRYLGIPLDANRICRDDWVCDDIDKLLKEFLWKTEGKKGIRFKEILGISAPNLIQNQDDKVIWVNKKGKENKYYVKEVWKGIRAISHKVIRMAIKGRLKTQDRISMWLNIQDMSIVNMPASNTIWSVIQRLLLGASVYYIWQERNIRLFGEAKRSDDEIFMIVFKFIRLRLMGLKLKATTDVIKAAEVWNFPIDKMSKYKIMIDNLLSDAMDIDDES